MTEMYKAYKHRLIEHNTNSAEVVRQLGERYHEKITFQELYAILNDKQHGPKAEKVKREVEELLGAE